MNGDIYQLLRISKNVFVLPSSLFDISVDEIPDDETFLENLKKTIKEYLTDLTYIDVTMLIGDPEKTKWRLDYTRDIKEQIV
jgi:hypothetical protein